MLTAATTQSITARMRGLPEAKSTGPVKNAIPLPTPTRQSSMIASAAGSHSDPSTFDHLVLVAKTIASTGTVAIRVVRRQVATASRSFSGSAWRRESTAAPRARPGGG